MADPFIAEIRIFPFDFAPMGWAWCDGQLISKDQNTALFSLLGTTYGGNGVTNFALPDLRGRAPMHPGPWPGLSARVLGEAGGEETVRLQISQIPVHSHGLRVSDSPAETFDPAANTLARSSDNRYQSNTISNLVSMAPQSLPPVGGGLPHNNMQPYMTFYFCIALQGIYPPRP